MAIVNHNSFKCIACGSRGEYIYKNLEDHVFGSSGKWSYIECGVCGLVWIDPVPALNKIDEFYNNYYTHNKGNTNSRLRETIKQLILATDKGKMGYSNPSRSLHGKIYGFLLSMIGPLKEGVHRAIMWLPANRTGDLLDIGCGSGLFLNNMRNLGWNVHGVEIDEKASSIARDYYKLENVRTGTLDDADFRERSFDAITMAHVIEHMPDPEESLLKCFNLLKPGGILVVTTPNSASLGRNNFKELWRGWEPPRHIYIFNLDSIKRIISRCGFEIIEAMTPASSTFPIWLESLLIREKASSPGKENIKSTIYMKIESLFYWAWEYILTRFGVQCGEELLLIAERPEHSDSY